MGDEGSPLGPSSPQGEVTDRGQPRGDAARVPTPPARPTASQRMPQPDPEAVKPESLASRRLSLSGLAMPTKALVVVALVVMAAGFALGLLQDVHQPETQTMLGTLPVRMSLPALVLVLLSFGLAWCVTVVAAIAAPFAVRVLIIGAFSLAMLDQGTEFSHVLLNAHAVPLTAALVVLWAWVEGWARRRRLATGAARERVHADWIAPIGTLLLAVVIQMLAYWSASRAPVPGVFAVGFVLSLTVFAYLATIRLSYSGSDFAEVFDTASSWLAGRSQRKLPAVLAAVGVLAYALQRASYTGSVPGGCALLLIAAIVVALIGRRAAPDATASLPWWAPVLAGVLLQGALIAAVATSSPTLIARAPAIAEASAQVSTSTHGSPVQCPEVEAPWCAPTAVYHGSRAAFSIAYPPGWVTANTREGVMIAAGYTVPWPGALLVVSRYSRSQLGLPPPDGTPAWARLAVERAEQKLLAGSAQVTVRSIRGSLVEYEANGREAAPTTGVGEAHYVNGAVWVVRGLAPDEVWRQYRPQAEFMLGTWRPDRSAPAVAPLVPDSRVSAHNADSSAGYFSGFSLAIFALLALVLLGLRPKSTRLQTTALFLLAATLLAGLANLNLLTQLVTGHRAPDVPHITFPSIEVTLAIAVLALLLARARGAPAFLTRHREMLGPATVLLVSVLLLGVLFDRFAESASQTGSLTGTEVAFLLGAFLWDVLMSGPVTNESGWLPRQARVLIYFGFALGSSGAVLYYSYGRELGSATNKDAFSPDADTAFSIAFIGVAYAMLLFATRATSKRTPT
jgi:hypothetical protein